MCISVWSIHEVIMKKLFIISYLRQELTFLVTILDLLMKREAAYLIITRSQPCVSIVQYSTYLCGMSATGPTSSSSDKVLSATSDTWEKDKKTSRFFSSKVRLKLF